MIPEDSAFFVDRCAIPAYDVKLRTQLLGSRKGHFFDEYVCVCSLESVVRDASTPLAWLFGTAA